MPEPKPAPPPAPPPTVLVVEDQVLVRLAVAEYLRDCGWRVLEAGNAAEALAVLEAADVAVDVLFSDVEMPGPMDGFGLARWVRAHRPGVRVLLTSGGVASAAAKAAGLCQDGPLLAKPYDHREVVRRIGAMLARAAAAASGS